MSKKHPTTSTQATACRQALSPAAIWAIILTPPTIIAILTVFSLPVFYDLHPYIWGENKLVESLQFPVFLFAGFLGLTLAWRTWLQMEKGWITAFYIIFGLGMVFIAGEEIAWGQQFLGFRTPDFIQSFNVQNEFTLHNVGAIQDHTDFLNLFFGIAGVLGIKLGARRKFKRIGIDPLLISWFSLILILGAFGVGFDFYLDGSPLNYPDQYPFHIQTETAELLIGMGSCLYLWLNLATLSPRLPRRMVLETAKVRGKHLEMQTPGGLWITSPISNYPWLPEADVPQRQNLRLTRNGTNIHWLDLGLEQKVSQLLKTSIASYPQSEFKMPTFKRIHVQIPIVVGLISMLWLILIPGDPQNAVLFGLSNTRLVMLAVGLGLLGLMGNIILRGQRDPTWRKNVIRRIDQICIKTAPLTGIIWISAVTILGNTAILTAAYTHPDPYIQGILRRLAPWAIWILVTALEAFLLTIPRLTATARGQLVRVSDLSFYQDQLNIKTTSQIELTIPISSYPSLAQVSQSQREKYILTGGGTRIEWPALDIEIHIQSLFHKNNPS